MTRSVSPTSILRGLSTALCLDLVAPTASSTSRWGPWLRDASLVLCTLLPFYAIYVAHFCRPNGVATGFIQDDMPYYLANAREIFERGNGITYPNPFDSDNTAPAIYFHWYLWLLGWIQTTFHWDSTVVFLTTGVLSGIGMAWMTLLLVRTVLPRPDIQRPLFVFSMWGGGLLCAASITSNLATWQPPFGHLLRFDPADGMWFLNWGRNVLFPTEATYHFLTAIAWYMALRGRWWWSLAVSTALAATHPWSGLQVLGTCTLFVHLRFLVYRHRPSARLAITSAACLSAFLYYNLVFLPSFPQHRELYENWHLAWTVSTPTALLAYGPIGLVAACRLWNGRASLREPEYFLVVSFLVAFSLAMHDRLIPARQPLHFTRGYVWMPLCLLALPTLQRWYLESLPARRWIVGMLVLGCLDNSTFCILHARDHYTNLAGARTTSDDEQSLFRYLRARDATGVLACNDRRLSYLAAVYTGARPFVSHRYLTPRATQRIDRQSEWFLGKQDDALERHVDFSVVPTTIAAEFQTAHPHWQRLGQFGDWCLLQKDSRRFTSESAAQ